MSIISIRDNENNRWKRNAKTKKQKTNKDRKEQGGTGTIVKRLELNDFCCVFKLGIFQLIFKALTF